MELPKRDPTVEVVLNEDEGVVAVLESLTSRELAELMDENFRDGGGDDAREAARQAAERVRRGEGTEEDEQTVREKVRLRVSMPQFVDTFDRKVRAISNLTVDGEEFDPENPDHLTRVPVTWKIHAGSDLVNKALIGSAPRKN